MVKRLVGGWVASDDGCTTDYFFFVSVFDFLAFLPPSLFVLCVQTQTSGQGRAIRLPGFWNNLGVVMSNAMLMSTVHSSIQQFGDQRNLLLYTE